ncbi:hypothetical protein COL68_25515 [Bacillus wiedmannii]|nr:hypothetical protein COL68_25515 [Bacillus wiedmannii]
MITGELQNKVDKVWEEFWTGGITDPLIVIEQFTYLLFIKGLDDIETIKENQAVSCGLEYEGVFPLDKQYLRWSKFKNLDEEQMFSIVSKDVFPFIKKLYENQFSVYAKYMDDAMFMIPTPNVFKKIVVGIDKISMEGYAQGELYEYLLSKVATARNNRQCYTPRHIIDMIVELMKPIPKDIIMDPVVGSGGFLVSAAENLRDNYKDLFLTHDFKEHFNNKMFYGFDIDRTMLRISVMNMVLHGVENPNIDYCDSLSKQNKDEDKYTLIFANPPFKGLIDYDEISPDLLKITKTKKMEILFLVLFLRMLKVGGRCAAIVPDGVLFGNSKAYKDIRQDIIENHKLEAVISMPSGVFKPYAGVSTSIIIFKKTNLGGTDNVWFYDMKADGYSLDDKRNPIENNDISDIIVRFRNLDNEKNRKRTEKSFFVPVKEIKNNDYDLSIDSYKEEPDAKPMKAIRLINFKGFKDSDWIELKKVTLLLGLNSSGKTSILNALLMLKQSLQIPAMEIPFIFSAEKGVDIGQYKEVIHNGNIDNNRPIEIWLKLDLTKEFQERDIGLLGDNIIFKVSIGFNKKRQTIFLTNYSITDGDNNNIFSMKKNTRNSNFETYSSDLFPEIDKKDIQHEWYNFLPVIKDIDYKKHAVNFIIEAIREKVQLSFDNLAHIGPLRSEVKRFYQFTGENPKEVGRSGEDTLKILYLDKYKSGKEISKDVNKWLEKFNYQFEWRTFSGMFQLFLRNLRTEQTVNIKDVGFGISQIVPIMVQGAIPIQNQLILIEEPEIHLHARAQSDLGDMFIDFATKNKKQFLVETHSEHLLLRIKRRIVETTLYEKSQDKGAVKKPDYSLHTNDVAVYFIDCDKNGTQVHNLKITEEGNFEEVPESFKMFFSDDFEETMKIAKTVGQIRGL